MTLFGSKKGYSKNDINFFEEFTASARKQTQVLAVVVFIGIIAIGLCLAVLGYYIWRNVNVQSDINTLNEKLASDEYAGLELRSQALQKEINDRNQYYYTLTEMRRIVEETAPAKTEIVNLISDCIPNDAYVTGYEVTGNTLTVEGMTFSYYDAANICYLLNRSNLFASNVNPAIVEDNSLRGIEETAENFIDVYYDFSISGNLVADSVITIGHYANTETSVIALSGVASQTVTAGSEYEFAGITNYTANGVNYTLASVSINKKPVSAEELALILSNDKISGIATGNIEISLYYNIVNTEAQTTEEGGAA